MVDLATLIREARAEKGLTVSQLAEAIGVTPTYLRELERGVKKNPSMQVVAKMAEVLGKPVGYFFGKEEEANRLIRRLPPDVKGYVRETILEPYGAEREAVESWSDAQVMEALVHYLRSLKKRTGGDEQ